MVENIYSLTKATLGKQLHIISREFKKRIIQTHHSLGTLSIL